MYLIPIQYNVYVPTRTVALLWTQSWCGIRRGLALLL